MYWRATVGSNHRFGCEASRFAGRRASFSPRRGGKQPRRSFVMAATALFDKWFEERETQAAGSWRIRWANARRVEQTLAISAFQAITMAHQVRGNSSRMRFV